MLAIFCLKNCQPAMGTLGKPKIKAIILGNSGSGKTWLAKRLGNIFKAPVAHLDDFFWEPGGFDSKRSCEEVARLIQQSKDKESWIVEGVFGEMAEHYLDIAELLVWLDIDWEICRSRLERRGAESKRHQEREQSEEGLRKLIEWASLYYQRQDMCSHYGHKRLFDKFASTKVCLTSAREVNEFLQDAQRINSADEKKSRQVINTFFPLS
jgi:adenylate kinase family enzyme